MPEVQTQMQRAALTRPPVAMTCSLTHNANPDQGNDAMSQPILPNPDDQGTPEAGTPAARIDSPTAQTNRDTGDSGGLLADSVGSPPDPAPDPFDPASLRLSQDFASSIGVKRVFTRIRCGKPEKHEFVRVRPGEEWRLETCLLELKGSQDKPGQETYLVAPALRRVGG